MTPKKNIDSMIIRSTYTQKEGSKKHIRRLEQTEKGRKLGNPIKEQVRLNTDGDNWKIAKLVDVRFTSIFLLQSLTRYCPITK